MYPSVSKYCAHCSSQYCSVRTVPISRQIVSQLHTSEIHCAKCTYKNPNIVNTAPLNIPLCAAYLSASKYCGHFTPQYCTVHNLPIRMGILRPLHHSTPLCAMFPSASPYCAHCTPQYSTVRNVPISIPLLRPLHHSIIHCAQCSHQHPPTAPTAPLNTPLCAMFPSAFPCCAH